MSPQKDHFSLIQAFSMAASRNSQLRLLLVGDGPLRPEEERRAMGCRGREYVQKHYDSKVLAARMEGVLWEAISRR